MIFRLNPPDNEQTRKIVKEVEEAESFFSSKKMTLGERRLKQVENIVRRYYEVWDEGFGKIRTNLKDLNKLLEGDLDKTEFPFGADKSSQIDLRLPAEKFRSLRANLRRVVFSTPQLVTAELLPGLNIDKKIRNKVEEAVNWSLRSLTNLEETLKDTDMPCFRDGTSLIFGEFVREVETGIEYKVYSDAETFQSDYPDTESAGIEQGEYDNILNILLDPVNKTDVRVEYEMDYVSKNGPEYTLFPLINFIFYPFFPQKIKDLSCYGFIFKETRAKFLEKKKYSYYYNDAIESMTSNMDNTTYEDEWDRERDRIEGINGDYKDAYKFAHMVVKMDLNNDKRSEYYNVIYWPEKGKVLRVEKYDVRLNIPSIVAFKFLGRDNRLLGISLLNDGKDIFGEINALHRHRSNRRRLTASVTMIAPDSMKESLGDDFEFTPGGTLWTPNDLFKEGHVPRQFVLQSVDNSDSRDEEYAIRFLEALLGPSMGMSGQESPSDPSAPGNKTAMLLQRADYRVADYIDEWKRTIPDLLSLHVSLLYQNFGSNIQFRNKSGDEDSVDMSVMVSNKIKYFLKPNSVLTSPESEMARIANIAKSAVIFGGIPLKINPNIMVQLWDDYVTASRIPGFEKYLLSEAIEKMKQMAIAQQQQSQGSAILPGGGATNGIEREPAGNREP